MDLTSVTSCELILFRARATRRASLVRRGRKDAHHNVLPTPKWRHTSLTRLCATSERLPVGEREHGVAEILSGSRRSNSHSSEEGAFLRPPALGGEHVARHGNQRDRGLQSWPECVTPGRRCAMDTAGRWLYGAADREGLPARNCTTRCTNCSSRRSVA